MGCALTVLQFPGLGKTSECEISNKMQGSSEGKKAITLVLKVLASSSLLAWVFFSQVNLNQLWTELAGLNVWLLLLAFGMHSLGLLFSALRWQKLLSFQEVDVGLLLLMDSYLVGSFFNIFMPTRIGGDMMRIADLRHATRSVSKSASSVFVERFLGISVLFFFALVSSLLRFPLARKVPAIWIGLLVGVSGLVLGISMVYFDVLPILISRIPWSAFKARVMGSWDAFRGNINTLLSKREAVTWGLWYSFLLQMNVVCHFWIIGQALDFGIPLSDYFFLIPVHLLILMLPTINGIGLREASSIILFGFYGVMPVQAALFGLIDLAMIICVGFFGWLRFMTRGYGSISSKGVLD